jgi:hypothetical protein
VSDARFELCGSKYERKLRTGGVRMQELIREIEAAVSIHVASGELQPETRARVDAMIQTYGRKQTLAAMRSLVEPFAAAEQRARPTCGGGMADQMHLVEYFRYRYLQYSIKYAESLSDVPGCRRVMSPH